MNITEQSLVKALDTTLLSKSKMFLFFCTEAWSCPFFRVYALLSTFLKFWSSSFIKNKPTELEVELCVLSISTCEPRLNYFPIKLSKNGDNIQKRAASRYRSIQSLQTNTIIYLQRHGFRSKHIRLTLKKGFNHRLTSRFGSNIIDEEKLECYLLQAT